MLSQTLYSGSNIWKKGFVPVVANFILVLPLFTTLLGDDFITYHSRRDGMAEEQDRVSIYVVRTGNVVQLPVIHKSESEWRDVLSSASFQVARQQGTEPAFSGAYHATKEFGWYCCVCCRTDLFSSNDKFDSGTGWPSFSRPVSDLYVVFEEDISHGMQRTEVRCSRCGAHLGHVFDDGPAPTGKRYCMNSLSLIFVPR